MTPQRFADTVALGPRTYTQEEFRKRYFDGKPVGSKFWVGPHMEALLRKGFSIGAAGPEPMSDVVIFKEGKPQ
jgi:hypothetical protein